MNISSFEAAALSVAKIKVNRLDADLNENTVEYTLCLDMNGLAKVLEQTGRDLTARTAWMNLSALDVTTICWCAFERFHPEVTLHDVRAMLTPAQTGAISNMLLELCFPGILERVQKAIAGEPQPNADSSKV